MDSSQRLSICRKGRLSKKTLVLISDGGDNMSEISHDELMRKAEESLATIYTVGIYDDNDKDKNPGFLKDLARITGGEAFIPRNPSHLVGVCEKIAKDIRNRYTIGYVPSNREYDGKPRKLKVTADFAGGKEVRSTHENSLHSDTRDHEFQDSGRSKVTTLFRNSGHKRRRLIIVESLFLDRWLRMPRLGRIHDGSAVTIQQLAGLSIRAGPARASTLRSSAM